MIDILKVSNLKSIDNITLQCSKYNLLIGTNSSGKSTIVQALLILSQNMDFMYGINGPLTSLGEFREVKNFNTKGKEISISVNSKEGLVSLVINDDNNIIINRESETLAVSLSYERGNFHYLSCNRIGGRDTYNKNLSRSNNFGINGEYVIDYLTKHGSDELETKLIKTNDMLTLSYQVNYWMKYIINANFQVENIVGTDVVKAMFSIIDGRFMRPKNVGSGVSYLVSIITICLGSQAGDVLIIENPEIHLHPLSQSRLSEFFYFIACSGRQIFVETHSDHLFNGIRVGISKKEMESKNVSVNFTRLNNNFCTEVKQIEFGAKGKILNPIDNLFDQFEIDLDKMLGLL